MRTLPTLLDHLAWADARARATILALDAHAPERVRATRLYAHLAAAAHVWLSRLEGRAPAHAVWPELALDEATALAVESMSGLRAIADGDDAGLARAIEYRTSGGAAFRSTVAEMLLQVVLHGSHHRGQIAMLAREGGGEPAATDFIVFARDGGRGSSGA